MESVLNVLVIEDSEDDAFFIIHEIQKGGYRLAHRRVDSHDEMQAALAETSWDIFICDYSMPSFNALEALRLAQQHNRNAPFIIVSGTIGEETAVEAMRAGAHDYIMKDNLARLLPAIERELRESQSRRDKRIAERLLVESEQRFKQLFEQAADAIFVYDEGEKLILANRSACEMLHYEPGTLLGLHINELAPSQDASHWSEAYLHKRSTEHSVIFESQLLRNDGSVFPVEVRLGAVDFSDHQCVLAIARDITDRKEAEKELLQYRTHLEDMVEQRTAELKAAQEKLMRQEKLATLGQLIAVVGHELRNPLGTVRASLFTIGEKVRNSEIDISKALMRAERNIVRCDNIIEDLLDYTRIKVVEQVPTAIDAWLAEILDEQIFGDEVEILRELDSGVTIPIDQERMRRGIINLITNACQALRDQAHKKGVIRISSSQRGEGVVITISDNGPGIAAELSEKIFEPLFSTRNFGVGLGLPIVKQIIEQHHGTIVLESIVEQGTSAIIELPLSVRSEQAESANSG